jgi:hypothetical protein
MKNQDLRTGKDTGQYGRRMIEMNDGQIAAKECRLPVSGIPAYSNWFK